MKFRTHFCIKVFLSKMKENRFRMIIKPLSYTQWCSLIFLLIERSKLSIAKQKRAKVNEKGFLQIALDNME